MSKVWYGSINNRLEENKMFCKEIEVGTGMTEYDWSDRHAYEVVEVKDQKHVYVREYDHKLRGEAYSNDWELIPNEKKPIKYLTKRGNYWYWTTVVDKSILEGIEEGTDKWLNTVLWLAQHNISKDELMNKKQVTRYNKANVSFGVAEYYYDYSF